MSERADLVSPAPRRKRRLRLPDWLAAIVSAGIVATDDDVRRRQTFTNVTAYAGVLNAFSHLSINVFYDFWGLIIINAYNFIVGLLAILTPFLHRHGPNVGAFYVIFLFILGHSFVVMALGLDSNLQIYYTLSGAVLFLFGIGNWRKFVVLYVLAFTAMIATYFLAGPTGFVMVEDAGFRQQLGLHALINAFVINAALIGFALNSLSQAEKALAAEYERAEALLHNILPTAIAARLKSGKETRIADRLDAVSVLFADLVGFTPAAKDLPPETVVDYLDQLFSGFDRIAEREGVDKIKTIGDAYMVAVGDRENQSPVEQAVAMGRFALAMRDLMREHAFLANHKLDIRIGIHHGPAIAGVIGQVRFSYDVWGEAVNTASRMESHGIPGRIQVSEAFQRITEDVFRFADRGVIDIKGMGPRRTFFLEGLADHQA